MRTCSFFRLGLFLLALVAACSLRAQDTLALQADGDAASLLVRAYQGDPTTATPALQATWRFAAGTGPSFAFLHPAAPPTGSYLALDRLMLAAIEEYLDQRIHFEKQGVRTDVPVERMVNDINAMVKEAAAQMGGVDMPMALKEPTRQQLMRVSRIDWSQARFGVDGGDDQDKYLAIYYYVRAQRQELERQLRADLLPLAGVNVLGNTKADPGRTLVVPTVCNTVFDDQNYLCALDLTIGDRDLVMQDAQLTDALMANIAAKARAEAEPEVKLRKRDRWLKSELDAINQRIDKLDQRKELWALRDRMDDMEGRLDEIGSEVEGIKQGRGRGDNPIANLSELTGSNITVRYAKGAVELDAEQRMLLNEVFEQLARAPKERVLITGYTDRSGDPMRNLALSEARAKGVRAYLNARGISGDRLLVNFYGDKRSTGMDPNERRVEIEWLR